MDYIVLLRSELYGEETFTYEDKQHMLEGVRRLVDRCEVVGKGDRVDREIVILIPGGDGEND